jgi:parallel beta-helix repeat protein
MSGGFGIYINGAGRNIISGNICINNADTGIAIVGTVGDPSTNNIVTNNVCYNNTNANITDGGVGTINTNNITS